MNKLTILITSFVISAILSLSAAPHNRPSSPIQHKRGPLPKPMSHMISPPVHCYQHPHIHKHHDSPNKAIILGSVILGSAVLNTITQPKTIIAQPMPYIETKPILSARLLVQVWIDGHYENQLQANGNIVTVWIPGHYEYR